MEGEKTALYPTTLYNILDCIQTNDKILIGKLQLRHGGNLEIMLNFLICVIFGQEKIVWMNWMIIHIR